jgi:hypothetical protein
MEDENPLAKETEKLGENDKEERREREEEKEVDSEATERERMYRDGSGEMEEDLLGRPPSIQSENSDDSPPTELPSEITADASMSSDVAVYRVRYLPSEMAEVTVVGGE